MEILKQILIQIMIINTITTIESKMIITIMILVRRIIEAIIMRKIITMLSDSSVSSQ